MAIAGTIERSSAITLPRVLERIFDQEQPGSLRLRHRDSGKLAIVKIDRGAVQETVFGDLNGDAAMREISQTFPLEYEFESSDTSITTGRLPVQPVARAGRKPALKLVGAVKPMMVLSGMATAAADSPPSPATAGMPVDSAPAPQAGTASDSNPSDKFMRQKKPGFCHGPEPVAPGCAREPAKRAITVKSSVADAAAPPPSPALRVSSLPEVEGLAGWVAAGDEFAIRMACSKVLTLGTVGEPEMDYFRSDFASLFERASIIGDVLGFSPPSVAAIVERERAAGYRRLADGFAGLYCGPDSTVDALISIL